MNNVSNLEQAAVEAAVERKLADLRTKRVAAAEARLSKAKADLATAQQEDADAARAYAAFPNTGGPAELQGVRGRAGNRERLLQARESVTLAQAVVEQAQGDLDAAKARHTPEQRKAMTLLVVTDRKAAAFRQEIDPVLDEVTELAREMALRFRAIFERTSAQYMLRVDQRYAHEQLGLPFAESLIRAPEPRLLLAEAILNGLRAGDFSPHDWADIRPADVIRRPVALHGVQAKLIDPAEFEVRNKRWQDSLHAKAQANEPVKALAQHEQVERGRAEAQARFDRQTQQLDEMHEQAGGRASLAANE